MIRWLRDWGPALAWAAAIYVVSDRSRVPVSLESGVDKFAHLGAYGVMGAALAWGGARRGVPRIAAALIGITYGALDEVHQMFVPGRSPEVGDWLADAAGVILGVLIFYPIFTKLRLRSGAP